MVFFRCHVSFAGCVLSNSEGRFFFCVFALHGTPYRIYEELLREWTIYFKIWTQLDSIKYYPLRRTSFKDTPMLQQRPKSKTFTQTWICLRWFFIFYLRINHHQTTIWETIFFPSFQEANPRQRIHPTRLLSLDFYFCSQKRFTKKKKLSPLKQILSHTIHGTGIFTYINGWFLW